MLYFLTEHTLNIYVQFILDFQSKNLHLFWFGNDSEHFDSGCIFERLKLDYSSSETFSDQ